MQLLYKKIHSDIETAHSDIALNDTKLKKKIFLHSENYLEASVEREGILGSSLHLSNLCYAKPWVGGNSEVLLRTCHHHPTAQWWWCSCRKTGTERQGLLQIHDQVV